MVLIETHTAPIFICICTCRHVIMHFCFCYCSFQMDEQIEAAKDKETYWAERVDELHVDLGLKETQRIKEVDALNTKVRDETVRDALPFFHGI